MTCSVICLSASDGAAGEEVAPLVARRLGFRLVDEQIIARAAEEAGVEQHVVAGAEQRQTLAARLREYLPAAGVAIGMSGFAGIPPTRLDDLSSDGGRLRALIRSAIEDVASAGKAVIVAHAASFALPTRDEVLRVFVTASPETRRRRVADLRGIGEHEAAEAVDLGDANRASYLKRFYGVGSEQPSHYDLVVNTDRRGPAQAADLIAQAAGA